MMNGFQATAVMVALFALRCVAPLVLMVAIGYLMNRLVDRWNAQDAAREEVPVSIPLPVLPAKQAEARPAIHCWIFRSCDEATRGECVAFKNPAIPCWLARLRVDGKLPAACADCPLYLNDGAEMPALAVGD